MRRRPTPLTLLACVAGALALTAGACSSSGSDTATGGTAAGGGSGDKPTIVVTTNILGDVVGELVGDEAEVVTIMPVGADPHSFSPSAQQTNEIRQADALIVNGAGFEEGLLDVIESAEADGVPTYEAISAVEPLEFADEHDHADEEAHEDGEAHADEAGDEHTEGTAGKDGEAHAEEEGDEHAHDGTDPHFFTDPVRMVAAVEAISEFLVAEVDGLDAAAIEANTAAYVGELETLDAELTAAFEAIPAERRVLVTNHEVFGYFADRFGFEVVGAVVPSGTTADGASAADLAALAEVVRAEGVPAIFADTSSSDELAQTLAAEVGGDVAVVELFSESLGEPGSGGATYLEMMRTNGQRIADALG